MKADLPPASPKNSHCVTRLHRFQFRLVGGRRLLSEALADAVFSEDDFVSVQDRRL